MVHLTFLVGQLACSVTGSGINYCRRHDFQITGFAGFVQEEVDQRALQLRTFSFINRETGSCYLYAQVEIYQIIFFCQFPVRQCIFGEFGFHTAHFLYYIIFSTYTFGYFIIRYIRNGIE